MPRRKKSGGGDSGGGWLNTYADMVTLLLAFFAVLLSMSSTDEALFNAFIESFGATPQEVVDELSGNMENDPGEEVFVAGDFEHLYQQIQEMVSGSDQADNIEVLRVGEAIYIRFSSDVFFEPNSAELRTDSLPELQTIGEALLAFETEIKSINVLGFTATISDPNATYWELSGARAASVATFLDFNIGMDTEKITSIGYGRRYPIAPNDSEENMRKNRRVELIVVSTEEEEEKSVDEMLNDFYDQDSYPEEGTELDTMQPENAVDTSGAEEAQTQDEQTLTGEELPEGETVEGQTADAQQDSTVDDTGAEADTTVDDVGTEADTTAETDGETT